VSESGAQENILIHRDEVSEKYRILYHEEFHELCHLVLLG